MLEVIGKSEIAQFPCARIHIGEGYVVVFVSKHEGVVLSPGKYDRYRIGDSFSDWKSCFDREEWEQVDIKITG